MLGILYWLEAFQDHHYQSVGARLIPLFYLVRKEVTPVIGIGAQAAGKPHNVPGDKDEVGSVERDLIKYDMHDHPLLIEDLVKVCFKLREALRGM